MNILARAEFGLHIYIFTYFSLAKFIELLKSVHVILIDFHWNGV